VGDGLNMQRWEIIRKIGEGQFAEVYEVADTFEEGRRVALKMDRTLEVKTVRQEQRVLKRLQACPCVVRLLEQGSHEERGFIVMELLGQNVADKRKASTSDGRWDVRTAAAIGQHLLDGLSGMHGLGYIHRDVKPANFAITPRNAAVHEGSWNVIDFGLARRYVDEGGLVLPARPDAAFRGSTTYASLAAHDGEDLGRRDDLWSWLYVVVEMVTGTLPWRSDVGGQRDAVRDKELAVRVKRECMAMPARLAGEGPPLPAPLVHISEHLAGLDFGSDPDYALLRGCLDSLAACQEEHAAQMEAQIFSELDTPLSPVADSVDTPASPPLHPVLLPPPLSRPAPTLSAQHITLNGGMDLMPSPLPAAPAPSLLASAAPLQPPARKRSRSPSAGGDVPQQRQRSSSAGGPLHRLANGCAARPRSRSHSPSRTRSHSGHSCSHSRSSSSHSGRSRSHSRSRNRSRSRSYSPVGRTGRTRHRSPERDLVSGRGTSSVYPARAARRSSRDRDCDRRGLEGSRARGGQPRSRSNSRGRYLSASPDRLRARSPEGRDRYREAHRDRDRDRDRDPGARYEGGGRDGGEGARRASQPVPPRVTVPAGTEEFQMDTSRCRHVHRYAMRMKEGAASESAQSVKKLLNQIQLSEGLGLAAYMIDLLVGDVSSKDADQMAQLLSELEDYTYWQRQRAKVKAASSKRR